MSAAKRQRLDRLHIDGFQVYKGLIQVDPTVTTDLLRQQASGRGHVIFNGVADNTTARGDSKRGQFAIGKSQVIKSWLAKASAIIAQIKPDYQPACWRVVDSLPGCQEQPPHTDNRPFPGLSDEQVPLALLVAVMPKTKLIVWPGSINLTSNPTLAADRAPIQRAVLSMDIGDVCIFRGDLVHAGAAYDEKHIRVHAFLDSPSHDRRPNETYLIDDREAVPEAIRRIICK